MLPLMPPDSVHQLESLAAQLGLADFDLLLIGDGSGTVYHQPAGWGCVAYDRRLLKATLHAGVTSTGTNNFAELFPYIQALWHHHQDHGQNPSAPVRVQVVSDSELTVRCGNGRYQRRANACLWASIQWFEQNGYVMTWQHVSRNSNPWSTLMDGVAGMARRLMVEQQKQTAAEQNVALPLKAGVDQPACDVNKTERIVPNESSLASA